MPRWRRARQPRPAASPVQASSSNSWNRRSGFCHIGERRQLRNLCKSPPAHGS
jgi:hypothetical protein